MNEVPFVQSVLFKSPYSGCCKFSGWKAPALRQVPGTTWPSPYNAPGAILCVDRYQKTWKPPGTPASPKYGPARATVTSMVTQNRKFLVSGPSSRGPFTYVQITGICWAGNQTGYVRSGGTGQNGGLS